MGIVCGYMNETIPIWFLVLGLFVPRITLLIAWLTHGVPANTIPFLGDAVMAFFIPRILIMIYVHMNMGMCAWFWVYLVVTLLSWGISGVTANNRRQTT